MLRLLQKYVLNDNTYYEEFDLTNEGIEIPITSSQTLAENPTKYTSQYSKSIKLPLTPKNMQIFNYYTELDSVVVNYTPTKFVEVIVLNETDVVFEGRLKLDKVVDYTHNHYIECTLYGEMNNFFTKMLNTTYYYDTSRIETHEVTIGGNTIYYQTLVNENTLGMHVLDNILDKGYNINKETVLYSWNTFQSGNIIPRGCTLATLQLTSPASSYVPLTSKSHSIIAWAPTEHGLNAEFDKDVIVGSDSSISYGAGHLVPVFAKTDEDAYINLSEEDVKMAEAAMGDGFTERQFCQYRSYYQKPCVYVNKLFQQYANISESYTGVKMQLDSDWFNSSNTRYTDVVYTLPDLVQTDKKEESDGTDNQMNMTLTQLIGSTHAFGTSGGKTAQVNISGTGISNNTITLGPQYTGYADLSMKATINMSRAIGLSNTTKFGLCEGDGSASCIDLIVGFVNVNDDSEYSSYKIKIVDEENTTWTTSSADKLVKFERREFGGLNTEIEFDIDCTLLIGQNNTSLPKTYKMVVAYYFYNGNIDNGSGQALFQTRGRLINVNVLQESATNPYINFTNVSSSYKTSQDKRSYFPLEMADLFPANYSPFNILLQYTKLFNLVWDYDQLSNTVTVMTKQKWFSQHATDVLDWTNKIDRNSEFSFSPLAWNKKFIQFNYETASDDWSKSFEEKYEMAAGTKRITTQYAFNNETEKLLNTNESDKINNSMLTSMYRYTLYDIVNNTDRLAPYLYNETFIGNKEGNSSANSWGAFYFRNNPKDWDTTSHKTYIYNDVNSTSWKNVGIIIADDTNWQLTHKIFAYDLTYYAYNTERAVSAPRRPIFSTYDRNGQYCIQFSNPSETYFNPNAPEMMISSAAFRDPVPVSSTSVDVYTACWSNIINEQYSEQNKLLTCYVKLDDAEFRKLQCNRFVLIGDVLYSIFKIYDYQLGKGGMTKVDLLQVWNLNRYTS